jgi:hypothetical protein
MCLSLAENVRLQRKGGFSTILKCIKQSYNLPKAEIIFIAQGVSTNYP